jgi:4-amino-4-deoxy-L-arabinose transferase-like glycosyltransferase
LEGHRRLVLAVLVGAALLLRLGCFLELNQGPCLWQHLWEETDMNFFDTWARDLAGGDWLTNKSLHPHHLWHQQIAEAYFRLHPEAFSALDGATLADGAPADAARVLWDRWYGGKTFHQEPLYPYLVGLTYWALGPDVRWVFLWQLLLGAASVVLVYLLARRYFGELAGAVAGLLAVLCGPLLFYDFLLLRESLTTFMWLSLVYLGGLALDRGNWRWWGLTGLACGLGVALRETLILYWLGLLGLLAYHRRGTPRVLLRSLAALAAGLMLALVPVVARNVAVGAPPLSLQSVGAITFVGANAAAYHPEIGEVPPLSINHSLAIIDRTGGHFWPAVVETLKTHPDLGSYLKQLWGKFAMLWHWYEVPSNENFYYSRLHSGVLRYLPVTFFLLAPLSLVGLALAAGRRRPCGPLYLAVVCNLVNLLFSLVISRYRLPLVALLLPFAALALVQISEWLWARRWALSATAVAALVALSWWTMRPLPGQHPLIRPMDYRAAYFYYDGLVQQAVEKGDWAGAAGILKDSLRFEPAIVRQMGRSFPAIDQDEAWLASWYAEVHYRYALALRQSGREEAAEEQEQRVRELLRAAQGK